MISQLSSQARYNVAFRKSLRSRYGEDELRRAETPYAKHSNSGKLRTLPLQVCVKSWKQFYKLKLF